MEILETLVQKLLIINKESHNTLEDEFIDSLIKLLDSSDYFISFTCQEILFLFFLKNPSEINKKKLPNTWRKYNIFYRLLKENCDKFFEIIMKENSLTADIYCLKLISTSLNFGYKNYIFPFLIDNLRKFSSFKDFYQLKLLQISVKICEYLDKNQIHQIYFALSPYLSNHSLRYRIHFLFALKSVELEKYFSSKNFNILINNFMDDDKEVIT